MLRHRNARYCARPRAAVFVWFLVVSVPLFMLASVLGIDFSRILIARNEVQLSAESAALSGASEATIETATNGLFVTFSYLDVAQATQITNDTFNVEQGAGSMSHAHITGVVVTVASDNQAPALNTVTVQVTYTVTSLFFLNYFGQKSPTFSTTAVAFLCVPGTTGQLANQSGTCNTPTR